MSKPLRMPSEGKLMQLDATPKSSKASAFSALGFKKTIAGLLSEIADLYQADPTPWVVGYSGGKDSTATLQLIWMALLRLEPTVRLKPVYVISTDTMVENPIVAAWVGRSLERMGEAAAQSGLPLTSHKLTPDPTESFWTTLIGRGYPAPRAKFRWCTDRLKINPSNRFISRVVKASGVMKPLVPLDSPTTFRSAPRKRNLEPTRSPCSPASTRSSSTSPVRCGACPLASDHGPPRRPVS